MNFNSISVVNNGYVFCKSRYYSCNDILRDNNFIFHKGINLLKGEIDSGNWAISYLISMYNFKTNDFVLFKETEVLIDGCKATLCDINKYSCYMDDSYPLFSSKKSVKFLVEQGLKKHKLNYTADEIRDLFCIDEERFTRPISAVGNEFFKAMAAIGYSNLKQIYCFPWMSKMRFNGFHAHLTYLLEILKKLDLTVVIPVGE